MATQEVQRGLFQDRGFLVIDFENQPVYPPRCMFTNKPITGLTRLKVSFVNLKGRRLISVAANALFNKEEIEIDLPISQEWKGQRDAATEYWGKLVWKFGLLGWIPTVVLMGVAFAIGNANPAGQILLIAGAIAFAIAFICTIVGLLWPYLEVPTSSTAIQGARLFPPHVWIQNVHPEFLKPLPKFEHSKVTAWDVLFGQ